MCLFIHFWDIIYTFSRECKNILPHMIKGHEIVGWSKQHRDKKKKKI